MDLHEFLLESQWQNSAHIKSKQENLYDSIEIELNAARKKPKLSEERERMKKDREQL